MSFKFKSATARLFLYFFSLAVVGVFLFQLPFFYSSRQPVPFIDALFTTISAICVTGLSTVDMSVFSSAGFLLLCFLIEAGGFGLVAFFTIYLVFSSGKVSLINRNIIKDYFTDDAEVEAKGILGRILGITFVVQAVGAVFLAFFLKASGEQKYVFYGIFLSISAFCNAGFAPYSNSLVKFSSNSGICIVISLLIIIGGLGFTVINNILLYLKSKKDKNNKHTLSLHSKIVLSMTFGLLVLGTILFFIFENNNAFKNLRFSQKILASFFQSVTLRTAGFETVTQAEFSSPSTFIAYLLMLIGGSPGSMAGGLKTTTLFLILCSAYKNPSDKDEPSVFHRDISFENVYKAVSVLMKGICFLCAVFLLLLLTESTSLSNEVFSVRDLFFETVSALGTVGVSKGITADISFWGKIILIITMFAGRTGITFIFINTGAKRINLNSLTDYPKEDVLVG